MAEQLHPLHRQCRDQGHAGGEDVLGQRHETVLRGDVQSKLQILMSTFYPYYVLHIFLSLQYVRGIETTNAYRQTTPYQTNTIRVQYT